MTRGAEIAAFLEAEGWGAARRAPLAGDASARRYERIAAPGRRAILMDVPPESGLDTGPFLAVARWLRANGLSAPEILAAAPERGLVLLEDFGDDLIAGLCAREPGREPELYSAAVETLARMQELSWDGVPGWTPPAYDMAVLMREARLMAEWYLPAVAGPVPPDLAAEYEARAEAAFAPVLPGSTVPIYRDYHAENLVWLPARSGPARIGLLDFQDMLIGHPAYDFVSLVRDARRDIPEPLAALARARYLARAGRAAEEFDAAAHILSAQRNLKILGLFTRLCRRDGKPRYLDHLPRVWRWLQGDLDHPALDGLRAFVAAHVPPPDKGARARIAGAAR
ncbi:aminoglycoside phosphotransferase family protein [Amaricoccus solimangrovi]|uniref:Aminoglycoside phosphotransferase n=1 Tax=Amaricoccus solimangrovi TaxID=2589815 RepID=A0A501WTK7_9RHOB|nr:phosphotransferase [Amaricoccus solimangrovi]TPE52738.1 aminoglycoside phosphotransferase [Amaricoccus solimangrovi]